MVRCLVSLTGNTCYATRAKLTSRVAIKSTPYRTRLLPPPYRRINFRTMDNLSAHLWTDFSPLLGIPDDSSIRLILTTWLYGGTMTRGMIHEFRGQSPCPRYQQSMTAVNRDGVTPVRIVTSRLVATRDSRLARPVSLITSKSRVSRFAFW